MTLLLLLKQTQSRLYLNLFKSMEAFRFIDIARKINRSVTCTCAPLLPSCSPAISSCLCSSWSHACCAPGCAVSRFQVEGIECSYLGYIGNRDSTPEKGLASRSCGTGLSFKLRNLMLALSLEGYTPWPLSAAPESGLLHVQFHMFQSHADISNALENVKWH